jgi:hypothetical protein
MLEDFNFKVPGSPVNGCELREGKKFNVEMPVDLDQFRREDSHGTVVGGKSFVQLGHGPADGRAFF